MEGNLEFEDDDGESYTQTKRLNIQLTDTGFGSRSQASATPVASNLALTRLERLHGDSGKIFVFKCLQCVLQKITPRIVDHLYLGLGAEKVMSIHKNLLNTVRLMWIRLVKRVFTSKLPTIIDLYSIVYLSLRLLNEAPINIAAYLFMMKENKVPFINATLLLPASMIKTMPLPSSYIMLTPTAVPLEDQFYRNILKWTHTLKIVAVGATSADCFHYQAFVLFTDLGIPQAASLLYLYHELVWKVTDGVFKQGFNGLVVGAEIQAISVMSFVLSVYFRCFPEIIDPKEMRLKSQASAPYFDDKLHRMSAREVFSLSDDEIQQYCDWVYDNVVASKYKESQDHSSELKMGPMDKKLFKIFPFERNTHSTDSSVVPDNTTLELHPNTLTKTDLAGVKSRLQELFCLKFGLKENTYLLNCRRFELVLFRVLRAEKAFS